MFAVLFLSKIFRLNALLRLFRFPYLLMYSAPKKINVGKQMQSLSANIEFDSRSAVFVYIPTTDYWSMFGLLRKSHCIMFPAKCQTKCEP